MTPKSLFNIILKVLGILFIRDIVDALSPVLAIAPYLTKSEVFSDMTVPLISSVVQLSIYGLLAYGFIFKSDFIIEKLRLTEGFHEEDLAVNFHRSTILAIAIIVTGALLVINAVPDLFQRFFAYSEDGQATRLLSPALKIAVGFFMMSYQRLIVNYIERKRKKQ